MLGTVLTAFVLRDCLDHSPTTARGLHVSTTCDWRLAYSWDIFSPLDLATRLIPRLPVSSGTTSVRCTYRCISYCLYDNWVLNLIGNSFQTLAPRAYVTYYQARGLSGHTSPCGECVGFFDPYASDDQGRYASRPLTFLSRNTSGHTSQDRNLFLFS